MVGICEDRIEGLHGLGEARQVTLHEQTSQGQLIAGINIWRQ